jgi:hypothetical protein
MMMPTHQTDLPRCANCGVEIPWRPAMHRGQTFCCGGCVQGGPCYCSYDLGSLPPFSTWPIDIQDARAMSVTVSPVGERQRS